MDPWLTIDVRVNGLATEDQQLVQKLATRLRKERTTLAVLDLYYNAEQRVEDLGISTPPALKCLHTVTGWPGLIVDALDERLCIEGFRYTTSTEADSDLWEIWQANDMDGEAPLATLDALVFGRAFVLVGSDGPAGVPLITVESPENVAVEWDARTRTVKAGLHFYEMDDQKCAALYQRTKTVYMGATRDDWEILDVDEHEIGKAPVFMLANRQRTNDRYGRSEITPAIRSLTDAACRTLLGLEGAREFYAIPQRYFLGVSEEQFQTANGDVASKWDALMSTILALPRDEETTALPQAGQFTTMSPAVYTEIINTYAQILGAIAGLPPDFLGRTTDNPASADAIRSAESRLNKKAQRKMVTFSSTWEAVLRFALALTNGGQVPAEAHGIETIWANPATPTPVATSSAVVAQVQAGILPADSDVTLEALDYTPLERARIRVDAQRSAGEQFLAQIAHSLQAKEVRTDGSLAKELTPHAQPPAPATPPGGGSGGG